MKTAVLFTGQERGLRRTIRLLKQNLIDANNAVVFLACETDNPTRMASYFQGTQYGGSYILPTLRTAEFDAFMHLLDVADRPAIRPEAFNRTAEGWNMGYLHSSGTVIQYYHLWKAWMMMLEYEKVNTMRFDVVVRCRPDSILTERLDFSADTIAPRVPLSLKPNSVVTFGHEQFWVARRDVFALLGPMVFTFGCWDSGDKYPFNSESFFDEFCKANHIEHQMFWDTTGEMFNTSHPGDEEVTSDPRVFSLLR